MAKTRYFAKVHVNKHMILQYQKHLSLKCLTLVQSWGLIFQFENFLIILDVT